MNYSLYFPLQKLLKVVKEMFKGKAPGIQYNHSGNIRNMKKSPYLSDTYPQQKNTTMRYDPWMVEQNSPAHNTETEGLELQDIYIYRSIALTITFKKILGKIINIKINDTPWTRPRVVSDKSGPH